MGHLFGVGGVEQQRRRTGDLRHRAIIQKNIATYDAAVERGKARFADWQEARSRAAQIKWETINHLDRYLEDIREVERRIQAIEARNTSGEQRDMPEAPAGVPDSFSEHVAVMFDIQALAFAADITRVFSFKMGRDGSARTYPESGTDKPFHPASHHGGNKKGVSDFQMINKYHVAQLPYFLNKLKSLQENDGNLLDKTMIIYGSPMADSNLHSHRRCPLIVLGHADGRLGGNVHIKAPDGTPMANAMLSMMHTLGVNDLHTLGDSTGTLNLSSHA